MEAKIIVDNVTLAGVKEGYRYYNLVIDMSRYTVTEGALNNPLTIRIKEGNHFTPIPGMQLIIQNRLMGTWELRDSFFNGMGAKYYMRDESAKTEMDINGVVTPLYRQPSLGHALFFTIKPVLCYYNTLTEERNCVVVDSDMADLSGFPDELIFSVFEHRKNGIRILLGDFRRFTEAHSVMEFFAKLLTLTRVIS